MRLKPGRPALPLSEAGALDGMGVSEKAEVSAAAFCPLTWTTKTELNEDGEQRQVSTIVEPTEQLPLPKPSVLCSPCLLAPAGPFAISVVCPLPKAMRLQSQYVAFELGFLHIFSGLTAHFFFVLNYLPSSAWTTVCPPPTEGLPAAPAFGRV